jgi:hypothetical protein
MGNHPLAQTPNVTGDILRGSIEYSSKKRSGSRLMCRLKFLFRLHQAIGEPPLSHLDNYRHPPESMLIKVARLKMHVFEDEVFNWHISYIMMDSDGNPR